MADENLQEPLIDGGDGRGNNRLQESIVSEIASGVSAIAATGSLGLGFAQFRVSRSHDALQRAELRAELAEVRRELELERRARIVDQYGLRGLDTFDAYGTLDPFFGFGVENEPIDFTRTDWFDVE